jgi:DNA mismatch repair protein MutS2
MLEQKFLELLQFDKIKSLLHLACYSETAKAMCAQLEPSSEFEKVYPLLKQTQELVNIINTNNYFPSVEHEEIRKELNLLGLDGATLHETQLLKVQKSTAVANSMLRFVINRKLELPFIYDSAKELNPLVAVEESIEAVIDNEGQVKSNASPELAKIRREINEKKRESDKRFYNYLNQLKKLGYLRDNEEGYYNGRRTLAVLVEYKAEVHGFVHSKSETGKTIFIEPSATIAINNEVAELEIDEQREINRILRELCATLKPYAFALKQNFNFLNYCDFLKAKALLASSLKAVLPEINSNQELTVIDARHPLLYLQNLKSSKKTIPLSLQLNGKQRMIVISGPNAGGKTIALKTIGLLQLMLQSGLLIPVSEASVYSFFDKILVDIGDTQSIENELSTYSAKLVSMTHILNNANEKTLVLLDEFGSGTDPELGSAVAEAVLENLVESKTRGVITSHFGNIKLLTDKLEGAVNASMLFDIELLEPKYMLSIGEPGSSYTFEVAEKVGFPKKLIEVAKQKINTDQLRLNSLIAEVQNQKNKLADELQELEHQIFLKKIAKEKYHTLFDTWQEKINRERERKIELSKLADFGQKYLRLMNDWNERKDRKEIIKRFIDGITAETKKQELLAKQKKLDIYAEKKIAKIKPVLKVGSKVKILNGKEVGVVEQIKDEKVFIKFGLMKMTVGMQNLVLVE